MFKKTLLVNKHGDEFTGWSEYSFKPATGELIFNTNNPSKGWDGTFQGREAQIGNYVYHIEYINSVGELTVKTNLVSLVR